MGDYTVCLPDPTDDDVFWTVSTYYSSGSSNWRSRIAAFTVAPPGPLYVDKNFPCNIGILCNGTQSFPYNTFQEALDEAEQCSEIIFLSSGDHEEIPASAAAMIADKRITITLDNNGSGTPLPVVIK